MKLQGVSSASGFYSKSCNQKSNQQPLFKASLNVSDVFKLLENENFLNKNNKFLEGYKSEHWNNLVEYLRKSLDSQGSYSIEFNSKIEPKKRGFYTATIWTEPELAKKNSVIFSYKNDDVEFKNKTLIDRFDVKRGTLLERLEKYVKFVENNLRELHENRENTRRIETMRAQFKLSA